MPTLRPTYSLLRRHRCLALALALALLAGAGPAAAQIGLPGVPQLPGGLSPRLGDGALRERLREQLLDTTELPRKLPLEQLRLANLRDLRQRHPAQLELTDTREGPQPEVRSLQMRCPSPETIREDPVPDSPRLRIQLVRINHSNHLHRSRR